MKTGDLGIDMYCNLVSVYSVPVPSSLSRHMKVTGWSMRENGAESLPYTICYSYSNHSTLCNHH